MVHRKGPDSPHTCEFSKKLLLSIIIYSIPDSRLRMEMVRLMHLRINQLGKLVSPLGCDGHQSLKNNLEKMVKAFSLSISPF
jgi:hypothetical protein